jgi:hypothetical protein
MSKQCRTRARATADDAEGEVRKAARHALDVMQARGITGINRRSVKNCDLRTLLACGLSDEMFTCAADEAVARGKALRYAVRTLRRRIEGGSRPGPKKPPSAWIALMSAKAATRGRVT